MNPNDLPGAEVAHLDAAEVARRLSRLADLEQQMQDRSEELAWTSERLVTELYDRHAADAAVDRLERFDSATGLPNRRTFEHRVGRALEAQMQGDEPSAVMIIGIERMKQLRETIGFKGADRVALQIADRLRIAVRGSDMVARIGDDTFALWLAQLRRAEDAIALARKLFDAIDVPLLVDGREYRVEPAVGVAVSPQDGANADLLLARAESAMNYAREHGTGLYQFFRPDIAQRTAHRLRLEAELRAAIERDQFRVHLQPRVDLRRGRVIGAEALLRWQHPERGLLLPGEFLDVAEETGLIVAIGEIVLQRACAMAARWPSTLSIAVNLSPREFRGKSMLDMVQTALRTSGLPAARLQIEITEAGLNRALDEVDAAAIAGLRGLGVQITLDDFGAGGASLSVLRTVDVDRVKIDGRFVQHAVDDVRDAHIVSAIVALARKLGLRVVAESVETAAQLALMKKIGCHEAQGFWLGRPISPGEFEIPNSVTPPARPTRAPVRKNKVRPRT